MIRSLLEHAERYFILGDGVRLALDYIRDNDLSSFAPGRYPIDGEKVFALIQEVTTLPADVAPFENHLKHADLQVTLRGTECVGYCPVEKLTPKGDYTAETDVQLYTGTADVLMRCATGQSFALFFPEDGHQPYVAPGTPELIKKVVIRIRLDMLAGRNI